MFTVYYGGDYWENYQKYLNDSPIMHVKNIETPTLIQHGDIDFNVSTPQSLELYTALYTALKARNVPVKLILYTNQDHGFEKKRKHFRSKRGALMA